MKQKDGTTAQEIKTDSPKKTLKYCELSLELTLTLKATVSRFLGTKYIDLVFVDPVLHKRTDYNY